jgi:hypothetical protein
LNLTINSDNYTVLFTCSVADLSGLKHEAVVQFTELLKPLPCLWRGETKEHFKEETKIM